MPFATPTPTRLALAFGAALLLASPSAHAQALRLDPATGETIAAAERLERLGVPAAAEAPDAPGLSATLTRIGRLADGETRGFDLVGTTLYRSNGGYLEVLDVANPAAPVVLGRFLAEQGIVQTVDVVGSLAYVAISRGTPFAARGSLAVVDVSNPAAMTLVGEVPGRSVNDVVVSGTTAYLGATALRLYDVSNPAAPVAQGVLTVTGGNVLGIALNGTTAYLSAGNAGFRVVDVSNPAAPTVVGSIPALGGFATRLAYADNRVYIAVQGVGLVIVDVSNPAAPVELGRFLVPTAVNGQVRSAAVSGTTAYVGDDRGFNAVDVSNPAAPTLRGRSDFGKSGSSQYILIRGTTAYVGNRYDGVRILDVSAPVPTEVGLILNGGFSFKVNVVGQIAYVADLLGQLRLIDLSNPAAPRELSRVRGLTNADGVDVEGGIATVVHRGAFDPPTGLITRIDVSNPAAPVVLSTTVTPWWAYGVDVVGPTVYVATGNNGTPDGSVRAYTGAGPTLTLLDEVAAGNQAFDVRVQGNRAYAATFGSGLSIFDVANPADMTLLNPATRPGGFSSSVEVSGTTAYLADGAPGSNLGLSVINVADPVNPVIVGTGTTIAGGSGADVAYADGLAYVSVDFVGVYQYDVTTPSAPAPGTMVTTSDRATGVDTGEGRYVVVVDAGAGVWVFEAATSTAGEPDADAGAFRVALAGPNPVRERTSLRYHLPAGGPVKLEVFDVIGRRVAHVALGDQSAGAHDVAVDARDWPAGVYVYRLTAGADAATGTLTRLR